MFSFLPIGNGLGIAIFGLLQSYGNHFTKFWNPVVFLLQNAKDVTNATNIHPFIKRMHFPLPLYLAISSNAYHSNDLNNLNNYSMMVVSPPTAFPLYFKNKPKTETVSMMR